MPIASVPVSAALTGSLGKLDNGHRHCPRRSPSASRLLRIAASPNRVAHTSVVSRLRQIAEDGTDAVIAQGRTEFPITSRTVVSVVIGARFGARISTDDVFDVLSAAYVSIQGTLIEVYNRITDLHFDDGK